MILTSYLDNGDVKLGIKMDKGILDVALAVETLNADCPASPDAVYTQGLSAIPQLTTLVENASANDALFLDEKNLTYAPVVPNPGKILCVGLNYSRHAAESGMAEPENPVLFSKFNNAVAAPNEDIPMSADLKSVDYEAELGVVIGKTARNVSVDEALDYVFGYCNMNDISERNLQFLTGQWLLGKTLDKFLPMGPYVVTTHEILDPQTLSIKGWYNGEQRQDSNTGDMIFSVAEVIAFASKYMTLEAGDVISTGTPEGVIMGTKEKLYMKPGDEYIVEVEGLGRLVNRMVEG